MKVNVIPAASATGVRGARRSSRARAVPPLRAAQEVRIPLPPARFLRNNWEEGAPLCLSECVGWRLFNRHSAALTPHNADQDVAFPSPGCHLRWQGRPLTLWHSLTLRPKFVFPFPKWPLPLSRSPPIALRGTRRRTAAGLRGCRRAWGSTCCPAVRRKEGGRAGSEFPVQNIGGRRLLPASCWCVYVYNVGGATTCGLRNKPLSPITTLPRHSWRHTAPPPLPSRKQVGRPLPPPCSLLRASLFFLSPHK